MRTLAMEPMRHLDEPHVSQVPVIPADASPALHEGLRRRRVAATLGRCPCGATRPAMTAIQHASAEQGGTVWRPFPHTADCPAHDDPLGAALAAWQNRK